MKPPIIKFVTIKLLVDRKGLLNPFFNSISILILIVRESFFYSIYDNKLNILDKRGI